MGLVSCEFGELRLVSRDLMMRVYQFELVRV